MGITMMNEFEVRSYGGRNWRSFAVLIWCRYRQGNGCPNG